MLPPGEGNQKKKIFMKKKPGRIIKDYARESAITHEEEGNQASIWRRGGERRYLF